MYIEMSDQMRKGALALLERGPTPRQAKRKEPFQTNSMIGRAYKLCCEGTTLEKLRELVENELGNYNYLLRQLRGGFANGKRWSWKETPTGYIKINPLEK